MTGPGRRGRSGRLAVASVAATAAIALAGCGGGGSSASAGDGAAGEQQLTVGKAAFATCAACHALADAGSTATIGPNLDDAFRGARKQGWEDSQIAGVTRKWIEIAEPPMPRNLVTGEDADAVAAYIAAVAGTDEFSAVRPAGEPTPEVPTIGQNDDNVEAPPAAPAEGGGEGQ